MRLIAVRILLFLIIYSITANYIIATQNRPMVDYKESYSNKSIHKNEGYSYYLQWLSIIGLISVVFIWHGIPSKKKLSKITESKLQYILSRVEETNGSINYCSNYKVSEINRLVIEAAKVF